MCAGRQLESIDRVAGHLAVTLAPFERAAQQRSGVVHPAARQAGSAHPVEGLVEFGRRDRAGPFVADRLFEPVGVGVCVAGECGVIESSVLSGELEVPGDQTVDGQLFVVLANKAVPVADFGDKCGQRCGRVVASAVDGAERAATLSEPIDAGCDADLPHSGRDRGNRPGASRRTLLRRW